MLPRVPRVPCFCGSKPLFAVATTPRSWKPRTTSVKARGNLGEALDSWKPRMKPRTASVGPCSGGVVAFCLHEHAATAGTWRSVVG